MQVRTQHDGDAAVLALRGDLDLASAPSLSQALDEACTGGTPERVVVDLRAVRFMDSSGLQALIRAYRWAEERAIELVLVRGRPPVHRVFELTRTDRLFKISPA